MANFPNTNTAYQLAVEYCTIQRITDYQEAYFAVEASRTPKVNTKRLFSNALNSFHSMADEFKEIMKGQRKSLKESLIGALRKYAQDEKLVHFRVAAATIIQDFNEPFPIKLIQTGEVLTDYFKDGFIVAHDFVSTANYLLTEYIDPELLIIPEESKNIPVSSPAKSSTQKIKTKFTVGQLAYLFRLFYDNELITSESLIEMGRFLGTHFQNKRTDEIDIKNITNLLSSPTQKDAEKVADKLKELMIKARNFEVKTIK